MHEIFPIMVAILVGFLGRDYLMKKVKENRYNNYAYCDACGGIGTVKDVRQHLENSDYDVLIETNITEISHGDPVDSRLEIVTEKCKALSNE